jgi:hypothetical protein
MEDKGVRNREPEPGTRTENELWKRKCMDVVRERISFAPNAHYQIR